MADEGPPKPKPGSLKDRIKQFEASSSTSSSNSAPPPLRPKPGTLGQWKPKVLEPPSPNKQSTFTPSTQDSSQTLEDQASGMSATDAMSSIHKGGGSLKERMAALQGKGAFGDNSAHAAPPLPSNEGKPRVWRSSPAPPVERRGPEESTSPTADNGEDDIAHQRSPIEPSPISPRDEHETTDAAGKVIEGEGAESAEPQTEEEQEREKRAAIAARMARLGGARVGMPVGFGVAAKGLHGGVKPAIPTKPRILTPGDTGSAGSSAPASAMSPATDDGRPVAVRQNTLDTALKVPLPKSHGSLLTSGSLDDDLPSESDATTSGKLVPPRSPAAPIPALPKRAAGPRRKKSVKELKPAPASEVEAPPVPLSIGEGEAPPVLSVDEPQVSTPTQEVKAEEGEEQEALKKSNEADQTDTVLTEEPAASSLDDLISAAPSEAATPPPPSPSVMPTEDEDEEISSGHPSRRPTIDVSPPEQTIIEEDGSQLLTPRPQSESDEETGRLSLSTALDKMMGPEPSSAEEKPEDGSTGVDAEEDELARKKRVAEKMARMGAVNPFSPGGFISPVSPHNDKQSQADVKKEEDIADKEMEESGLTKSAADNDSHVDLAAHESESNVPVLSQNQSTRSGTNKYNEETDGYALAEGDEVDLPDLDVDVEYPMMSPTAGGHSETYMSFSLGKPANETESHKTAAVESSPQDVGEKAEHSEDDERADTETIHEDSKVELEESVHPQRITRTVPPPPQLSGEGSSFSTENSNSQFHPTAYEFEDPAPRAVLAAALSRRAPMPPPAPQGHQQSVSPTETPPPQSISPTPSPPLRPFEREGAPSPPSLNGDDEEYDEEEEDEYLDYEVSVEQEEFQGTPTEEVPIVEQHARTPSPPPVTKTSPPPLPGGRPPVPNVRRSIPPPPRHAVPSVPPNISSRPPLPVPKQSIMVIPDSPVNGGSEELDHGASKVHSDDEDPRDIGALRQATARPALPPPRRVVSTPGNALEVSRDAKNEQEIMDDDECDPVDPGFVRHQTSQPVEVTPAARIPNTVTLEEKREEASPDAPDPELDAEAARRRGIAERMAKLGGIKFGVPATARPSQARKVTEADEVEASSVDAEADSNLTPEEAERTRRAGIAARMAAMGGRGLGMYGASPTATTPPTQSLPPASKPPSAPLASPPPIPGSRPKRHSRDDVAHAITRPPPPAPANDQSMGGETSESEVEMINAEPDEEGELVEQVEDEEPELVETPPAPPNRSGRPPVPPTSRPPLPPPGVPPSLPIGRREPPASPPSEYEVISDERTAPTKPRVSHSRSIPAPSVEPATNPSMESSGQWELPNIPSGSFDLSNYGKGPGKAPAPAGVSTTENDSSWTKVDQEESKTRARVSTSTHQPLEPFAGSSPTPISAEALVGLAHRLGPTIISSAQHIHEKSKRLVIGDGSSTSFLFMVLSPISGVSTSSFGHLVYAQTGNAVQKRLGDIMPGDIIALYDARFKGHKGGLGLGAYSLSCGTKEEPMLGVIGEFEAKKNKIKAFAVNQHPNSYPSIDTPSYKLDDLKAGTLKVFRVAESL